MLQEIPKYASNVEDSTHEHFLIDNVVGAAVCAFGEPEKRPKQAYVTPETRLLVIDKSKQ